MIIGMIYERYFPHSEWKHTSQVLEQYCHVHASPANFSEKSTPQGNWLTRL